MVTCNNNLDYTEILKSILEKGKYVEDEEAFDWSVAYEAETQDKSFRGITGRELTALFLFFIT